VDSVGDFVSGVVAAAGPALPIFVVYGLPNRDCTGGHSAGGLSTSDYLAWVRAIAQGLSPSTAVIVEPDALASAPDCNLVRQREELLSNVVGTLAPVTSVYVDAGHANWVPAQTMVEMLSAIGIERARGFAVNVSAYDTDESERKYADEITARLPGVDYVIDSSRNGAGGTTEWCNPPGQALGQTPAAVDDGTALDAHLWIKPPGESDGTCNGGPAAGTFWPARAVELARNAGWN
jgi:endoglucanase